MEFKQIAINDDYLNQIYLSLLNEINNTFNDFNKKLSNTDEFIKFFNMKNLNKLKNYCYNLNINPELILKNIFVQNVENINIFFRKLFKVETVYTKLIGDEFISTVKYKDMELIKIYLINKNYKPLITINNSIKELQLAKQQYDDQIIYYNQLLNDKKLINKEYKIKKIKIFKKNITMKEAILEINCNIQKKQNLLNEIQKQIDNIMLNKNELQIKTEFIIEQLNIIDFNNIKQEN